MRFFEVFLLRSRRLSLARGVCRGSWVEMSYGGRRADAVGHCWSVQSQDKFRLPMLAPPRHATADHDVVAVQPQPSSDAVPPANLTSVACRRGDGPWTSHCTLPLRHPLNGLATLPVDISL